MKILSVGDSICEGEYRLHSGFNCAANFINKKYFLSLVNSGIGAGPINIVVKDFDFSKAKNVKVKANSVTINDELFQFSDSVIFDSKLHLLNIDEERLKTNLKYLKQRVINDASDKSLAFILDELRLKNFTTKFEENLTKTILGGVNKIYLGKIEDGIKEIRGVGFGLTPSGDDFVAGFLFGLHLAECVGISDANDLIKRVRAEAKSNNPIADAFLRCAGEGCFFDHLKRLIILLCYDNDDEISRNVDNLLTIGANSGSDLLTGFITTFNNKIIQLKT
ncbi:DUF2877 domain-containing protein [bacterium]|nr:DUF2877 domain-containing protein [bacterium]